MDPIRIRAKLLWILYLAGEGSFLELVDVGVALLVAGPHQVRLELEQGGGGGHVTDTDRETSAHNKPLVEKMSQKTILKNKISNRIAYKCQMPEVTVPKFDEIRQT